MTRTGRGAKVFAPNARLTPDERAELDAYRQKHSLSMADFILLALTLFQKQDANAAELAERYEALQLVEALRLKIEKSPGG